MRKGQGRQKCLHCDKRSIPGLVKGQGLCQYHWDLHVWGKAWADFVHNQDDKTMKEVIEQRDQLLNRKGRGEEEI